MLGIRTRGRRMVGTDETTELWRPPRSMASFLRVIIYGCFIPRPIGYCAVVNTFIIILYTKFHQLRPMRTGAKLFKYQNIALTSRLHMSHPEADIVS